MLLLFINFTFQTKNNCNCQISRLTYNTSDYNGYYQQTSRNTAKTKIPTGFSSQMVIFMTDNMWYNVKYYAILLYLEIIPMTMQKISSKKTLLIVENVVSLVKQSDSILFVRCISYEQQAETRDRTEIELPSNQITAANIVNNQPIIPVLTYRTPTVDKCLFDRSNVIIGAGYNGQMFGEALISLLNDSYVPVGRISTTWYQNRSQLPDMINFDMKYPPGHTYKYLTQLTIYSFVYGSSDVDFDRNSGVNSSSKGLVINPCDSVTVLFSIENNGNNVVQVQMKYHKFI